jgi:CHAT domain-containing protein
MNECSDLCHTLVLALTTADEPAVALPDPLPCEPLDLLIALHAEVLRIRLVDLARTRQAAAAAWVVVQRFPDEPLLRAQAHWTQGNAILYIPDYVQALDHYDQALHWYEIACQQMAPIAPRRDIRVVYNARVFCLCELGRYNEAIQAANMAEEWLQTYPDDDLHLALLINRSLLLGNMGQYAQMVELADAAIALATRLDNPARLAYGWINRAYASIYLGRFAEAEAAITQGIVAAGHAGESITVARAQWNQARLLRCQGQLFAALTALQEAGRGLSQAEGEAATVALEAAMIYERLRQLPEARRAARFAAEEFARQLMPAYSASAALQAVRIAAEQGQAGSARTLLDMAKTQAVQVDLPVLDAEVTLAEGLIATLSPPDVAPRTRKRMRKSVRNAVQSAVTLLQSHGLVQAITAGHVVLAKLDAQLGQQSAAIAAYRDLTQHTDRQVQITANAELGALLPPSDALPYLQRAAALAVEQRRLLPMEELQARYSSETSPYHLRLAGCYLELGDPVLALETIWAAKAGPLLDLRAAVGALDSPIHTMLETAKADLSRWREQLREHQQQQWEAMQQGQSERAAFHRERAAVATRELQAGERALTEQVRTLGDRSGQAHVPTLSDVQAALGPGQILLEFAQIDDTLICFLVQSDQPPRSQILGDYHDLAALLDHWSLVCHRLMEKPTSVSAGQEIRTVLAPLWDILIAPWQPMLAAAHQIIIAPFGILHHIPWAALSDDEGCLGDRAALTLMPCGAMWAATLDPPPSLGPPRLLGYAGSGARQLAHATTELATIARHLPDAQVVDLAAAADLRTTPPPRLLHIASHGESNPNAPICSTLELADGPFLLWEAHRLNLRGTQLVTLSACETSVRPDHGDMALALAGAFLCAGAHAVLASLWAVSDAATAALMDHFYAALADGMRPDVALRHAQQRVCARYPLDWAAFQIWAGAEVGQPLF